MKHKLNVKKIIDDLCGEENPEVLTQKRKIDLLVEKINGSGCKEIKARGIEKWIDKNTISGPRLADLAALAASMGIRFNLYRYMIDANGNAIYKDE